MEFSLSSGDWLANGFLVDECCVLNATNQRMFGDMDEQRKERHRAKMVKFRLNKKRKLKEMRRECRQLERETQTLAARQRVAAVSSSASTSEADDSRRDQLRERTVETGALQGQNWELRKEIGKYEKFQKVVLKVTDILLEKDPLRNDGADSLTRDQFDVTMARFDSELASGVSSMSMVGSSFGWMVLRAPLSPSPLGCNWLVVRTQVSKRLQCSFHVQEKVLCTKQRDLSPVLLTPECWGLDKQTKLFTTRILQELDQDLIVFMHTIPRPGTDVEYLCQVRRALTMLGDGRRKLTASMVITDADTSAGRTSDVKGGIQVSITEVDENSVDVSFDHWAGCESEMDAEHLTTQLMQLSLWWEQLTVPSSKLLNSPSAYVPALPPTSVYPFADY